MMAAQSAKRLGGVTVLKMPFTSASTILSTGMATSAKIRTTGPGAALKSWSTASRPTLLTAISDGKTQTTSAGLCACLIVTHRSIGHSATKTSPTSMLASASSAQTLTEGAHTLGTQASHAKTRDGQLWPVFVPWLEVSSSFLILYHCILSYVKVYN